MATGSATLLGPLEVGPRAAEGGETGCLGPGGPSSAGLSVSRRDLQDCKRTPTVPLGPRLDVAGHSSDRANAPHCWTQGRRAARSRERGRGAPPPSPPSSRLSYSPVSLCCQDTRTPQHSTPQFKRGCLNPGRRRSGPVLSLPTLPRPRLGTSRAPHSWAVQEQSFLRAQPCPRDMVTPWCDVQSFLEMGSGR